MVAGCVGVTACGAESGTSVATNAEAPSASNTTETRDADAMRDAVESSSVGTDACLGEVFVTASDASEPETRAVAPPSDVRDAGVISGPNAQTDSSTGQIVASDSDTVESTVTPVDSQTCGILRRIALPDVPLAPAAVGRGARDLSRPAFVQRVAGAFVVGPWVAGADGVQHLEWLWVSDDGQQQNKYSSGLPGGGEALFAMANVQRLTWIGGSTAGYYGGFIDDGAADFEQTGLVLDAVYSIGRTSVIAGVSLDGERGLMAAGLTRAGLVTFGSDGGPIGVAVDVADTGSSECWRHLPTEHGNVFVHEDGRGVMFAREFSSSGGLVGEFSPPGLRQDVCPEAALLDDGYALLAYQDDSTWHSYRVRHDGVAEDLWQDNIGIPLTFAVMGDATLVVTDQDDGAFVRVQGGEAQAFAFPEFRWAKPIPAEAGKLFLDLAYSSQSAPIAREIVEIQCTP